MMTGDDWEIEFYIEDDGGNPVSDFLKGLDPKTRARFGWSLDQLRVRNVQARPPLVKHLDDDLWELREESNTNIYRIVYVFFHRRRIVLLHGFQKKSQKTPVKELETARRRLKAFRDRNQQEN